MNTDRADNQPAERSSTAGGRWRRTLQRASWVGVRWLLLRRYRVRVEGAEDIVGVAGSILVLPNHPAYIDPALVMGFLPVERPIRPLVYADTYRHPVLSPWLRCLAALEVPELRRERRLARKQMVSVLAEVAAGLERGENFLLYPSGRLQRDDLEILSTARSAHEIVQRVPQSRLLLVRSRGVWGSMFSCAGTGEVPPLSRRMWQAGGWLICGALFWLPKRDVTLTCQLVPADSVQGKTRSEFNRWLEDWYNADGGEMPRYVPYHPWLRSREPVWDQAVSATIFAGPAFRSAPAALGWRSAAAVASRRVRHAARVRLGRIRNRTRARAVSPPVRGEPLPGRPSPIGLAPSDSEDADD